MKEFGFGKLLASILQLLKKITMKEFDFGELASILQLLKKIRRIFFCKDFSQEF